MATDEICDGIDNDLDGLIDEGSVHPDADGDGFGAPGEGSICVEGGVEDHTDCDDGDPLAWPGATEQCDGVDNDCDGDIDEFVVVYHDRDGDGAGNIQDSAACGTPGTVNNSEDCNDKDADIHPDADEPCDHVDNDCDGLIDDGVGGWLLDLDGDGWGADEQQTACTGEGYAEAGGDCDDDHAESHPGGIEVCDGLDNDCDGEVDGPEALDPISWYLDLDEDGVGAGEIHVVSCDPPPFHSEVTGDCADGTNRIGRDTEYCWDGLDNDCNGLVDCEDASCGSYCTELCEGGVDEDDDGLVDCEDDDCWGKPPCVHTTAWVTSGRAHHGRHRWQYQRWALVYTSHYQRDCPSAETFALDVVSGSQQASAAGLVRVSGSDGALSTCTWSVDSARWSWFVATTDDHEGVRASWFDTVDRTGFHVSSNCPLDTSGFLPRRLGGGGTMKGWSGYAQASTVGRFYQPIVMRSMSLHSTFPGCWGTGWNLERSSGGSFPASYRSMVDGDPYIR